MAKGVRGFNERAGHEQHTAQSTEGSERDARVLASWTFVCPRVACANEHSSRQGFPLPFICFIFFQFSSFFFFFWQGLVFGKLLPVPKAFEKLITMYGFHNKSSTATTITIAITTYSSMQKILGKQEKPLDCRRHYICFTVQDNKGPGHISFTNTEIVLPGSGSYLPIG